MFFLCYPVRISHYLLNKRIIIQLFFIDKLTVYNPGFGKTLTKRFGINIIEFVMLLIVRRKLFLADIDKIAEFESLQSVINKIL